MVLYRFLFAPVLLAVAVFASDGGETDASVPGRPAAHAAPSAGAVARPPDAAELAPAPPQGPARAAPRLQPAAR